MTQFRYDCPHCLSRNAGFGVAFQWGARDNPAHANVLGVCGICNGGLVLKSWDTSGSPHASLTQYTQDYPGQRYAIIDSWPNYSAQTPDHTPENVARFYEQGMDNLQHARWDAAGAMFRKSLDVATKILAPQMRQETLYARIGKMVEDGQLTPSMGDWSHEIRLEGNGAVHDDEPETEQDARAAHKFAEALLTYSFTLPQMVNDNREKRETIASQSMAQSKTLTQQPT